MTTGTHRLFIRLVGLKLARVSNITAPPPGLGWLDRLLEFHFAVSFFCPLQKYSQLTPSKPKRNSHWCVWHHNCQRQRLGCTRVSLQHRWRPSSTLQSCPSSPSAIQPAVLRVPCSPRGGSCVDHHERGCESGPILPRFRDGAVQ